MLTDLDSIFGKGVPSDKIKNAINYLPPVSLYAVGGFPIKNVDNHLQLLGQIITIEGLREQINEALGLSGILTHANKSNLTLREMGELCKARDHFWGYNWITLSFLFVDPHPNVELSFLRNSTFYQSWIVGNNTIYGMSGSIKDFKKFVSNKDDKSFDYETRNIMSYIHDNFGILWN